MHVVKSVTSHICSLSHPSLRDRAVADAVSSGSPDLRWLSQALIACRGCCPSEALSGVLEALLSRLTGQVCV